jgi:hypothetical protein
MKKLFTGESNVAYFCLALLAAWIALNEFTLAVADSDGVADFTQIVSIGNADDPKAGYSLKGRFSDALAVKGDRITSFLALIPQESQKLIAIFTEPLLKIHVGDPETLHDDGALSMDEVEYNTIMKDGAAKQLLNLEAVGRYLNTQPWIPEWLKNESHSLNFAPETSGGFFIKYTYRF